MPVAPCFFQKYKISRTIAGNVLPEPAAPQGAPNSFNTNSV
jgi:hypothetical protein